MIWFVKNICVVTMKKTKMCLVLKKTFCRLSVFHVVQKFHFNGRQNGLHFWIRYNLMFCKAQENWSVFSGMVNANFNTNLSLLVCICVCVSSMEMYTIWSLYTWTIFFAFVYITSHLQDSLFEMVEIGMPFKWMKSVNV